MGKGKRGGARPNSGPAKGTKYAPTLKKEAAREVLRAVVMRHMDDMLRAQIAHAKGIGHLYTRDKNGKFTKIENQAQIDRLLLEGTEDQDYWIFAKDPSVQAFTDLMNRALDKPKEQEQELEVKGALRLIHEMPS
jgi:hypothetical protein